MVWSPCFGPGSSRIYPQYDIFQTLESIVMSLLCLKPTSGSPFQRCQLHEARDFLFTARSPKSGTDLEHRNLFQLTQEEIQILLVREGREKLFLQGITLAGTKCLLIRDNLYTEGNNTMDLRTKSQSWGSQAVTVVQVESVYLVVMGQKGTEGGPLNFKAFEMAGCVKEAIHQHMAHF
nr:profilin-2-like [Odocoileus virginianus texanus]